MSNAVRTGVGVGLFTLLCMLIAATLIVLSLPGCTSTQLQRVQDADAAAQNVCDAVVLVHEQDLELPASDVMQKVCRDRAVTRRLLLFLIAETKNEVARLKREIPRQLQGDPYAADAGTR